MISFEEIVAIHQLMIIKFGGSNGIRDTGLLESAIKRPWAGFGDQEVFSSVEGKAAAGIESIIINHPFIDGNKRTGYALMLWILAYYGKDISASESEKFNFVISIAKGKNSHSGIEEWIKNHIFDLKFQNMSDKNLSSEEQRQLMKEQYKKDLRLRKEFLEKVKGLRHQKNILGALEGMNIEDDTDDWISKLNQESAFTEAKLDLALDSQEEQEKQVHTEEEMKKIIAEGLVEEMKAEMAEEAKMETLGDIVKPSNGPDEKPAEERKPGRKTLGDL